jgi:hypothetical protein
MALKGKEKDPLQSAISVDNLAVAMNDSARYAEAEALHRQVLDTRQKEAGPESLPVSGSLTNLASVKLRQGTIPKPPIFSLKQRRLGPKILRPITRNCFPH